MSDHSLPATNLIDSPRCFICKSNASYIGVFEKNLITKRKWCCERHSQRAKIGTLIPLCETRWYQKHKNFLKFVGNTLKKNRHLTGPPPY